MKRKLFLPGLAVVLGCIGGYLRQLQLNSAYEPDTGLLISGCPETVQLIVYTIVAAVLCAVLGLAAGGRPFTWKQLWSKPSPVLRVCMLAAGGTAIVSGVLLIGMVTTVGFRPLPLLLAVLLIPAGVCQLMLTTRNGSGKAESMLALLPGFASCVWLLYVYHINAANSVVLSFVWEVLAICSCTVAHYFAAGTAMGKSHPSVCAGTAMLSVILCLTAAPTEMGLWLRVLYVSNALWFTGLAGRQLAAEGAEV